MPLCSEEVYKDGCVRASDIKVHPELPAYLLVMQSFCLSLFLAQKPRDLLAEGGIERETEQEGQRERERERVTERERERGRERERERERGSSHTCISLSCVDLLDMPIVE